jgi:hypothetical protein
MTLPDPLTMTARCPEDLLAMVPVTLGFTPEDSVAMLTFGGVRTFQARVDLPARRDEIPEAVEALLGPARIHGVRQVAFVVYSGDEVLAGRLWRALRDGCRRGHLAVVEALRVDSGRWYPLMWGDRLTREIGVPFDVSAHPFLVAAVLRGRVTHRSREELDATLDPDPARVAAVTAAVSVDGWGWARLPSVAAMLEEGGWVQDTVRRCVATASRPTDHEAVRLLHDLQLLRLRDAAWAVITHGDAPAHVELWTDLVQRCPRELLPAPAALLGWAAWQAGHGALAWCAVDRARGVEPGYRLAAHVAMLLEHAVPPESWELDFDWAEGLRPPTGQSA